jgi:cell division GTPase FtsZ
MRIVALGLGGAGCRIVDSLYAIDRKSSRIACVEGLAVDVDETTLRQLLALPDSQKLYYPPFDPMNPDIPVQGGATATIDIAEIISRIHNFESGENDAIFICCGLGGQMTNIIPHIITGLRSTVVEPIFGLVTFPCLAEGEKKSAKAADDIDILSSLLDGMVVFDNETWYKKTRPAAQARLMKKEKGLAQMLGIARQEPELSPEMLTYHLLNEAIVRRISLILKAGEFRADGGIDLAEVVLDSGEVLNTMKNGGFITIGYAVEHLPSNPLAFLSQFKPSGPFNEEGKKRASRIVELAKQAIYHEVSTPCDMTSAHKALILIAGPSHELSMQGFMTVRKWIDRSIRGLETRSGDYPVMNTKNVAIIVMLSGLENIPRINELREIREQLRAGPVSTALSAGGEHVATDIQESPGSLRDDMIVLPSTMKKVTESIVPERKKISQSAQLQASRSHDETVYTPAERGRQPSSLQSPESGRPPYRQVPLNEPQAGSARPEPISNNVRPMPHHHNTIISQEKPLRKPLSQQPLSSDTAEHSRSVPESSTVQHSHEHARQRIERELQRQRMMALSGSQTKTGEGKSPSPNVPSGAMKTKRVVVSQPPPDYQKPVSRPPQEGILEASIKKTVIIRKRAPARDGHEQPGVSGSQNNSYPAASDAQKPSLEEPLENMPVTTPDDGPVVIKDQEYRAKDHVFQGKGITGTSIPKAKDDSLMHTSLKPKKTGMKQGEDESSPEQHGKK